MNVLMSSTVQDGHAATLPSMMRENSGYRHYFRHTGAVVTIHNAGLGYHQEIGDLAFAQAVTGLPMQAIMKGRLGAVSIPSWPPRSMRFSIRSVSSMPRSCSDRTMHGPAGWGTPFSERGVILCRYYQRD
jgi:starch synthase